MKIIRKHQHHPCGYAIASTGLSLKTIMAVAIAVVAVMGLPVLQSKTPAPEALRGQRADATDSPTETNWRRPQLPPRRSFSAATAYDKAHAKVVVFGGRDLEGNSLNSTWTWDGVRWTAETPALSPPARYGGRMAYDLKLGKVILFGGLDVNNNAMNDTWSWDGTNWAQLTPATSPPARGLAYMAYDAMNQAIILFGGVDYPGGSFVPFGDTWIFESGSWTQLTPAVSPNARASDSANLAKTPENAGLILFGGYTSSGLTSDTWLWNGETWTPLSPANVPPARIPALAYDAATSTTVLYLYTDQSDPDIHHTETWTWDGADWTKFTGESPPRQFGEVFVYHEVAKKILFYGGAECDTEQWTWDGTAWTQRESSIPRLRAYASVSFDTFREQSVLFGGEGCSGLLADTWVSKGRGWREVHPSVSPSVRAWASMAYDPSRHVSVLFGGRTCDIVTGICENLSDTWTFDGTAWVQKSPAESPSPREGAVMAFDSVGGKLVLFGGTEIDTGILFADTWTWDGITWTEENPSTRPPEQVYVTMSPDALGRPTLFTFYGDTWRWNGATNDWESIPMTDGPPARYAAGMGFDARSGNIILFGGVDFETFEFLDDTWAFDGTIWQQLFPVKSPSKRYFPAMSDGSINSPPALMGGYDDGSDFSVQPYKEAWTWGIPTKTPNSAPTPTPTPRVTANGNG